ncbi:MAG: type III pantothenate kinase [Eubacterium sp.]|nr:type III pantothenate kinase [Eubacterium sp.]
MILVIDVGNTNTVLGIFEGESLIASGRLATVAGETADDWAMKLHSFIIMNNAIGIEGAVVSSVVPALNSILKNAIKTVTGIDALVVGPGVKTGLNIRIDNPAELGADLVVGAVASINKYPCPQVIFDFGTATTASVIDSTKTYIGGVVMCGVRTAVNAIASNTAQLPQIDISAPEKSICSNTIDCMRSGAVFGAAVMLDGLVEKFEEELGQKLTVIVTGGLGRIVCGECKTEVIYDNNLLLDGLRIIYEKNR